MVFKFNPLQHVATNESRFFLRRINLDDLEKILPMNAQQVYYETGSYEGFKYDLTLRAVEAIMWNDYELGKENNKNVFTMIRGWFYSVTKYRI